MDFPSEIGLTSSVQIGRGARGILITPSRAAITRALGPCRENAWILVHVVDLIFHFAFEAEL